MEVRSSRPHVCIINVQMEMSYLLDTGEVSGQCINAEYLKKNGITPQFNIVIHGKDLEDCINRVKVKLEQINAR